MNEKKHAIIISVICIVLISSPILVFGYVKFQLHSLQNETFQYLETKGYLESDIKSVETGLQKLSLYTAFVKFENEPEITYEYKKDKNGEIIQIGATPFLDDYEYKNIE